MANKTLHLVLKRKWWDMIESGEKKEDVVELAMSSLPIFGNELFTNKIKE